VSRPRETLTYDAFGTASREEKDLPAPHHSQARGGTLQGGRSGRSATRWRWRTSSCDLWWPRPGSRPELAKVGEDGVLLLTGANVLVADDVADTGKTLELVRDFCSGYVAEVRTAVIYEKPRSLVRCDYEWRRTDRWIDFPWSSLPPVVPRRK